MSKKSTIASTNNNYKYYLIIAIACFVLYGKSINNDFNIDDDYVYENHRLVKQGIKGIPEIFTSRYHDRDEQYFGYRPLTIAIYAIEYEFFGMNPHSAHFFNIIYYIICCSLLFYLFKILLTNKLGENAVWYSFLITIIFTTHAIHSEVVLSLKNREEIICLILCLLSTIYALKYFDERKLLNLILSIIFLTLGFLAKENAVVFIGIIPLIIVFFKTEISIFENISIKHYKWKSKEQMLTLSICLWIILFLLAAQTMEIYKGFIIYKHSVNIGINHVIVTILFMVHYFYIVYRKSKAGLPISSSIRNIIIWISCIILSIFTLIDLSTFPILVVMILLIVTLIPNRNKAVASIKVFDKVPARKTIYYVLFLILLSTIAIITVYYIPKQSLPEINAPVHKWQNPIFYAESSLSNNAGLVFYSLIYYIKLLIIPYPLRYYYGYSMIPLVDLTNPIVIFSIIFHVFLIVYAIKKFNRRELVAFGILFYLISILPFSNLFFPFTGIVAERVLFIPSIGFSIVLVYIIYNLIGLHNQKIYSKSNVYKTLFLAGIFILPNSIITINRNDDWKNRDTLFATDIKVLENSAKANNVYASHIFGRVQAGIRQQIPLQTFEPDVRRSIKHYQRAIEIDSTYSEAWHNLGYIYMILYRDYARAEYHYSKCLENDSTIAAAYLNRGITNYHLNNYSQAITDFEDYVNKNTHYQNKQLDKAFVFSGKSYLSMNDTANAIKYYRKALNNIKYENLTPAVLRDMIDFFVSVDVYEDAIYVTEKLIELTPDNNQLYVDIGNYYLMSGDTINAIKGWERSFEHYRGNYSIAMTLKNYFESIGEYEKAQYYYEAANEFQFRQNQ